MHPHKFKCYIVNVNATRWLEKKIARHLFLANHSNRCLSCVHSWLFFFRWKKTRFTNEQNECEFFVVVIVVAMRKLSFFSAVETTKSLSIFLPALFLSLSPYLCVSIYCKRIECRSDIFPMMHARENCVLSAEKNCCAFKRINPGALLSICNFFFIWKIKIDWNWNGIPRYPMLKSLYTLKKCEKKIVFFGLLMDSK